jgi:putative hydrolase of the HAD superfamily
LKRRRDRARGGSGECGAAKRSQPVWLFDLDNTLHDASHQVFGRITTAFVDYIERELSLPRDDAERLRMHYWRRYGATLLGLERHHGVVASHFLNETHALPGVELRLSREDRAALARLPGRKVVLTNAPALYAQRVLDQLKLTPYFEAVVSIEQMRMFGELRPKPDARSLRFIAHKLKVRPSQCVLVEDSLENQRSARRVGMRAVWMQRYLRGERHGPEQGVRSHCRPAYVHAKIKSLQALRKLR